MATETLAVRLKRLRLKKGLSQNALGTMAGLQSAGQAIYKAEKGERSFQPDTARRVAAVLEVTPEYLLYGFEPTYTGEMPPLDIYLRETVKLQPDDIEAVSHLVRRLAETATPYEDTDELIDYGQGWNAASTDQAANEERQRQEEEDRGENPPD